MTQAAQKETPYFNMNTVLGGIREAIEDTIRDRKLECAGCGSRMNFEIFRFEYDKNSGKWIVSSFQKHEDGWLLGIMGGSHVEKNYCPECIKSLRGQS